MNKNVFQDRCAYDFSDVKDQVGDPRGKSLGHIRILTSVYVLNVILPEEAFKALLFKGTLNNQGKEFKIEIKISQMPVDNIQCEKD